MGAVSPDRAGHPALSLRLLGDALPAAQAGGGGAVAAAASRQVFVGVRRFYLAMVNLPPSLLPQPCWTWSFWPWPSEEEEDRCWWPPISLSPSPPLSLRDMVFVK